MSVVNPIEGIISSFLEWKYGTKSILLRFSTTFSHANIEKLIEFVIIIVRCDCTIRRGTAIETKYFMHFLMRWNTGRFWFFLYDICESYVYLKSKIGVFLLRFGNSEIIIIISIIVSIKFEHLFFGIFFLKIDYLKLSRYYIIL